MSRVLEQEVFCYDFNAQSPSLVDEMMFRQGALVMYANGRVQDGYAESASFICRSVRHTCLRAGMVGDQ
jgi:hypothetical protein